MVTNDYIFKTQKFIFESYVLAVESTFDRAKFSIRELSKIDQFWKRFKNGFWAIKSYFRQLVKSKKKIVENELVL